MKKSNEFIEYLVELLHGVGEVKARAMFGGYGLYLINIMTQDDIMFALVTDEILYFKTDSGNIGDFKQRKLEPFKYQRNGKQLSMSYHEAPGEVLDDADEMTHWAIQAIAAAKRNAAKKNKK